MKLSFISDGEVLKLLFITFVDNGIILNHSADAYYDCAGYTYSMVGAVSSPLNPYSEPPNPGSHYPADSRTHGGHVVPHSMSADSYRETGAAAEAATLYAFA